MPASPNRVVAFVLGLGFAVDATVCLVGGRGVLGILFGIAAAALVLTAFVGIRPARVANIVAGAVWLALGYAGLFLVGSEFNVLALTAIDEVVLFAAAVVHLAVALGARRDRTPDDALSTEP
jgi:hypothetical protein